MGQQTLADLKLTIQAISTQRAAFELLVDVKLNELILENPEADLKILKAKVLASTEMQAEYSKLVNLYSLIGSQSNDYLNALTQLGA